MDGLEETIRNPNYVVRPEPGPIPPYGMFDDPVTCLRINRFWGSHILGVLEALDQLDAWIGDDSEIEAARDQVRLLMMAIAEPCEGEFVGHTAILEYRTDPNTNGGSAAAGLNTIPLTIYSDPGGLIHDLSGGEFWLMPGFYRVNFQATAYRVDRCQTMLRRRLSGNLYNAIEGISSFSGAASTTSASLHGAGVLSVSIPTPTFFLATYAQTASANFGLGVGLTDITIDNVFALLTIQRAEDV